MSEYHRNPMLDQDECFTTLDAFATMLIDMQRAIETEMGLVERPIAMPDAWDHEALGHPDHYPVDGEPQYRLARLKDPLLEAVTAQMERAAAQHPPRLLTPRSPLRWDIRPPQEREFIVPEWLPVGVTTKLDGAGGTGKSLLAQQLMTCCALERPFLGLDVLPVKSLALFCEDDDDELGIRQARINRAFGVTNADLTDMRPIARPSEDNALMYFDGHQPRLTPLWHELRSIVLDGGYRLVVLDTKHDVFRGEANDPQMSRAFITQACTKLAQEMNGAVLLLDHPSATGQNQGTGESGSKQWEAAVRSRWYFKREQPAAEDPEPDPDVRTLTRMKGNYAPPQGEFRVRYRDGVFVLDGADGPEHWLDRAQRENAVDRVFLDELGKAIARGEDLVTSSKAGRDSYAPARIKRTDAGRSYQRSDLDAAMWRALEAGDVKLVDVGRPSRPKKVLRLP